jgi:uncharacterized membrane protein YeaQ/YmgE (transglycosylase-associated protein family)
MDDVKIARITGVAGLACVALTFVQFPLWLVGTSPSVYDGRAFATHLFSIKNVAFTRILMDQGIYVSMLVFAAGLRHLIRQARSESEWIGTLLFGAALGWVAVTVVADGLEGGAVLDTLNGNPDPSAVRALIAGTLLIYNGSIAFAITGLFLASAAWRHLIAACCHAGPDGSPSPAAFYAPPRSPRCTAVRSITPGSTTPAAGDQRSWRTFRQ